MSEGESQHWVEKVHPLSRQAEPDDPYQLMAEPVMGAPMDMLEGLLQEFAWLGYSAEELLALFRHPGYPLLCELREYLGEDEIRRQVNALCRSWGQLRFRETIVEDEPDPVDVFQIAPLAGDASTAQRSPFPGTI